MTLDATTETIAHFIGLFELTLEEARLRAEYDAFRALLPPDELPPPLEPLGPDLLAPHRLGDFSPDGGLRLSPSDVRGGEKATLATPEGMFAGPAPAPFFGPLAPAGPAGYGGGPGPGGGDLVFEIPPPSSAAVITVQTAHLSDDDLLGSDGSGFVSPEVFHDYLLDMAALGQSLWAFALPDPATLTGDALALAKAAAGAMDGAAPSGLDGVEEHMITGDDALGIFVDGKAADAITPVDDVLPAHLLPDPDADPLDSPWAVEDGHNVMAGGNAMANEAIINANWLDALVFAVRGDVYNIDAITQVNVLSDRDAMPGADTGGNIAMNAAEIALSSNAAPRGEGPSAEMLPKAWAVTRLEGDVVLVNWLKQFSFATDNDRAEINFTGSNTFVGLGENKIANAADILELGFGYDLIVVGGNMISLNMINQMNVLLDNDSVAGGAGAAATGGGNLLYNIASIVGTGIDTFGDMTEPFAKAAEAFANGATKLAGGVAGDALFKGLEVLRVLYIDGDFTTVNAVEQTNILGDADQVRLAMDDFEMDLGVELTMGANALVNAARIGEWGIDSHIMAGGQVYSDALIHQAGLVDEGAPPTGVAMPGLASEAVAFLADGMIESGKDAEHGSFHEPQDAGPPVDVMQTVLA